MKFLIVLSVCLAGAYASSYNAGYNAPAEIRVSSYEAPATRMSSYSAPSYTAQSYAAPVEVRKAIVPIVNYNMDNDHYGTFKLDHTSGDGTIVSNVGSLRNLGDKEGPVNVQTGSYSYLGDDKVQYTINWSADENGFVASGAHLPTPPPVPQEIQESLRLQASAPSTYSNYESNYESPAPVVRVAPVSYSAPVRAAQQVYEAPAIRVVSSGY